jgi:hypothetical protein
LTGLGRRAVRSGLADLFASAIAARLSYAAVLLNTPGTVNACCASSAVATYLNGWMASYEREDCCYGRGLEYGAQEPPLVEWHDALLNP